MAKKSEPKEKKSVMQNSGKTKKGEAATFDKLSSTVHVEGRKRRYRKNQITGLKVLSYPAERLKSQIKTEIVSHLAQGCAAPEIVEGLVEFLVDVVREDPRRAYLFGLEK